MLAPPVVDVGWTVWQIATATFEVVVRALDQLPAAFVVVAAHVASGVVGVGLDAVKGTHEKPQLDRLALHRRGA